MASLYWILRSVCMVVLIQYGFAHEEGLTRETRSIIDVGTIPWPNGIVYYSFSSDFGRGLASSKDKVLKAMAEWSRLTCIKFVQTTSATKGRMIVRNGSGGCNASKGFPGKGRTFYLSLEYPGCINYRVALHELGHILGISHEHQNPQRTNLQVHYDKIETDRVRWFYAKHPDAVEDFGIKYDPLSVMHYNREGFAKVAGTHTMTYSNPSIDSKMGKVSSLSVKSDVAVVKKFYDCDGTGVDLSKILNKYACYDNFVDCNTWAGRGECISKSRFMRTECRKSCSICRSTTTTTSIRTTKAPIITNTGDSSCKDLSTSCSYWKRIGQCTGNSNYMNTYCKQSCNKCSSIITTTTCSDNHDSCSKWASLGECSKNPSYMMNNCKLSCSVCRIPIVTTTTTTTVAPVICTDKNQNCYDWAARGECKGNPNYMLTYCKSSCNVCSSTCVDSAAFCPQWATSGHCLSTSKHFSYMNLYCKKSCNRCNTLGSSFG